MSCAIEKIHPWSTFKWKILHEISLRITLTPFCIITRSIIRFPLESKPNFEERPMWSLYSHHVPLLSVHHRHQTITTTIFHLIQSGMGGLRKEKRSLSMSMWHIHFPKPLGNESYNRIQEEEEGACQGGGWRKYQPTFNQFREKRTQVLRLLHQQCEINWRKIRLK